MLKILYAALEALGAAVPTGLGALVWLGFKIGPELIPSMLLAMLCGLAIANFCGSGSQRPQVLMGRFFAISLLVGFVDSFVPKLASWGLADTPQVRFTLVFAVCVGAALLQPLFYALRLQRLARVIPAPVFAGFMNAVALLLVISQIKQVQSVMNQAPALLWPSLGIGAVCLGVAVAVYHLRPRWPAAVLGLVAASAAAWLLGQWGQHLPAMMSTTLHWGLPISQLDGSVLHWRGGAASAIWADVALVSLLLGLVMFLDTIVTAETMSQLDDKPAATLAHNLQLSAGQIISACLGSIPMSGTPLASMAAHRVGGLQRAMFPVLALLCPLVYLLGVLAWLPQAAMMGLLLFSAYSLFDRDSVADVSRFAVRPGSYRAMSGLRKEDLLIVFLVALAGALINIVAALLVGMVLGLVLFARRNGKSPIKDLRDGRAWHSNCVRSASDMALLQQHGERIQCVRLQGALFFGVAGSLRAELEALLAHQPHAKAQARWLVLDWHAVVSHDSTVATMFARLEQGLAQRNVTVLHCARPGEPSAQADLDRALERCENELLSAERPATPGQPGEGLHHSALLAGLADIAQGLVRSCFESRHYAPGDRLLTRGELSRDLYVIASGSANVMIQGGAIRLAGVSSGAMVGEMGFLDGTPRAADVVAAEPLVAYCLSRERFDALASSHPELAQHMLQNLCTELAGRLRALHVLISRERS